MNIRVVHLSASDLEGGAARAAFRLHIGLRDAGIDSHMLVKSKKSDDGYVHQAQFNKIRNFIYHRLDYLLWLNRYPYREDVNFSISYWKTSIIEQIRALDPDIVHLHWISDNFLSLETIARLKKPVVWSMHDMNPFTGGCHYDNNCNRYLTVCGNCPVLHSTRQNDLSTWIQKRKKKIFAALPNLTMVGLSRWMQEAARASYVLEGIPVVNLPNGIDIAQYKPVAKETAKNLLSLPSDKKVILFGAQFSNAEKRKGFHHLLKAMKNFVRDDLLIVVFGAKADTRDTGISFPVRFLGNLHDDLSLCIVYSAADVMVVPSEQENLSNGIMESMACGTPVVAFNIGGNPDMIQHQRNGYLARHLDADDLGEGIRWVIDHKDYEKLAINARNTITERFDIARVAGQYAALYRKVLGKDS